VRDLITLSPPSGVLEVAPRCELLRRKSEQVEKIDSEIKALAGEMAEFMRFNQSKTLKPVGLSAVQLGELVRIFAFYTSPASEDEDIQFIINPELVYEKGKRLIHESCLSIPGGTFVLKRAKIVKIRGLTMDGEERSFRGHGLLAQVFQHELNHLDGILIDQLGKETP